MQALAREFGAAPVTLVLALLAILFALVQFFDSLHLKRTMRRVLRNEDQLLDRVRNLVATIEDVARSLSSRFIGTFPKNMKDINTVVARADRNLIVLTDWVGYGMYSNPEEFEEYKRTLRDLRTRRDIGIPVLIAAYDETCLRLQFSDQFKPKEFPGERTNERFISFFKRYHPRRTPPATYEQFITELLRIESELRRELIEVGVEIQEISERSLILLWMEDGEDAVFCFQARGGNERGLSFRTRDIGLLTSLHDTFAIRWKGAAPELPHVRSARTLRS